MSADVRAALAELVALKDLKEDVDGYLAAGPWAGSDEHMAKLAEYERRKPLAWAAARAALAQPAEPVAGWRMVPMEPTTDMRNAFHAVTADDALRLGESGSRWAAMIAAAPPAPQPELAALRAERDALARALNTAEANLRYWRESRGAFTPSDTELSDTLRRIEAARAGGGDG